MALKKEKTASGGEIGEVAKRPSLKDKLLKNKKRTTMIAVVIFFSLGIVMYAVVNISNKGSDVAPTDDQRVDKALQQMQEDPSSVRSGEFKPELGDDYFLNGNSDSGNQGATQQ